MFSRCLGNKTTSSIVFAAQKTRHLKPRLALLAVAELITLVRIYL